MDDHECGPMSEMHDNGPAMVGWMRCAKWGGDDTKWRVLIVGILGELA
jgi:hypothetical protein